MDGLLHITQRAPCWGLLWIELSMMTLHLWMERNRRYKEDVKIPATLSNAISMRSIIFNKKQVQEKPHFNNGGRTIKAWTTSTQSIPDEARVTNLSF